ncbi:hypothetical protein HDR61_02555 [bacterium]|nr:hypothetical protein [bacterium]
MKHIDISVLNSDETLVLRDGFSCAECSYRDYTCMNSVLTSRCFFSKDILNKTDGMMIAGLDDRNIELLIDLSKKRTLEKVQSVLQNIKEKYQIRTK